MKQVRKRDYKREYALYHGKPVQIKRRTQRNAARRELSKTGLVSKGDGMDVHHKDNNPAHNDRSNLTIISKFKNRSIK